MLLAVIVLLIVFHRRRWYGNPYWAYPCYRGSGPYGPSINGYTWNGYAWQPTAYGPGYGYGSPYGYGCYRRPYGWW